MYQIILNIQVASLEAVYHKIKSEVCYYYNNNVFIYNSCFLYNGLLQRILACFTIGGR